MCVILDTLEAVIRKIAVQGQPGQIVHETLSRKYPTQKGSGGVAQVVQYLLSQHEALSSNPSTTQKKKERLMFRISKKHSFCFLRLHGLRAPVIALSVIGKNVAVTSSVGQELC
jgi:hypothetical protein